MFHSPVTVEADLAEFAAAAVGKAWKVPPLGEFYCDGVTIESIVLSKEVIQEPHEKFPAIRVVVDLRTRTQADDMAADLEFVIVNGDKTFFLGKIINVQVDAGEEEGERETFQMSQTDYDSALTSGGKPMLRLTMTTRPN